jgi:polyisoprenoid-binding protein YceI
MTKIDVEVLPAGLWEVDRAHSSIGFAIGYLAGTFRGSFGDFDANAEHGVLTGSARVGSVKVKDEYLTAHLQGPDFFDADLNPEISFASVAITREGDAITVDGAVTIKGHTEPVGVAGTISGPITDQYGGERFGLSLEATIDRERFGVSWNTPLPGGDQALSVDVTITAELQLLRVGTGQC